MKKQLVASLAAAMILGVAGTSFAATNPFSDVPAKHWSYDAVSSLAKAGIVDGYGDGTFKGDKMISRYEMAQIVAKAMAKSDKADAKQKAEIDKLAAEFAEELNTLGVRVSALEKKVGTVKVTGDARIRFVDTHADNGDTKFSERFRLNFNADVNENTSFYGRYIVLNHNEFGKSSNVATSNEITDAAFTTKNLFGTNNTATTIGRFSQRFLTLGYFADTTGGIDGAKVAFGNKLRVTAGFGNFNQATGATSDSYTIADDGTVTGTPGANGAIEEAFFAEAAYDTSKVTNIRAMYLKEKSGVDSNYDVKGVSFSTKVAKDLALAADYTVNSAQDDAKGSVYRLTYKAVKPAVQGSWDAWGEYRKFETGANVAAITGAWLPVTNVKGAAIGVDYTLAKNIVFNGMTTFNSKTADTGADADNYTRLQINYNF